MHSSRMRTGRSLTVCCSLLPGGGSVCLVPGGGCPWSGGGCLPGPGGGVLLGPGGVGVLPAGGVCLVPGGVLLGLGGGGCSPWSQGVGGGCLPGPREGGSGDHPPPWTEFLTHACENITLATTSLRPVIILITF